MRIPAVAAAALALASFQAIAASIVPAQPTAFQFVNLRMTVDSCAFDPSRVRVALSGSNHFVVTAPRNQCFAPGEPRVVDVGLGALPAGSYTVSVHEDPRNFAPPYEEARFDVTDPAQIAIVPPPPRPLSDYSGLWWNPNESGWGLSLHQGPTYALFGAWFVYGANGEPQWYTLQGGQWTSSTRWTGQVYRTTGPFFAGADFDPRLVLVQSAGTATLDFSQSPGSEGVARLIYNVGNVAANRPIQRMPF
jgi:hypothetical protein